MDFSQNNCNNDIFLKNFSNFFLISKFEESQNTSMVSKISIGILFKMVYSIESHRKTKILALNSFFLQSQKKIFYREILFLDTKIPPLFDQTCKYLYLILFF